jgi:hypothetical protein
VNRFLSLLIVLAIALSTSMVPGARLAAKGPAVMAMLATPHMEKRDDRQNAPATCKFGVGVLACPFYPELTAAFAVQADDDIAFSERQRQSPGGRIITPETPPPIEVVA